MTQLRAMKRNVQIAASVLGIASVCAVNASHAQTLSAAPSDSIVKLAVDGATRAGVPAVTLLDEMEIHLEANGTGTRRYRTVTQFLNDQGARARAEQSFGYAPGHQKLTMNWVRVLKPTGEVISDKPAQTQDADVPAAMQNPVYQDQKIRRLSLGGVANGTILDISWTLEEKAPYRSGDFYDRWSVNKSSEIIRSLLVVTMPETYQPRLVEKNLNFKRIEKIADKQRTLTWATSNVERVRGEPFAADSNDVIMSVTIAPPGTWGDIAKWYSGLAKDRYVLTPDVAKRVDSVVAAAKPRARIDTLRAIHRWVAQDVRYVSVSLGMGGYQPRAPEQVLATGFGDCKDKATLFVAAARKYGIDADPVLLSSFGASDRATPSIFQFNHAIAAVKNGKDWTFTDLTAESIPYGVIPPSYQGSLGVIVLPDGRGEEVTFPLAPIDSNASVNTMVGELKADGSVTAHIVDHSSGAASLRNRQSFYAPMDSANKAGALRSLGSAYFKDGIADSLVTFNGKDLASDPLISFHIGAADVLKNAGNVKLFTIPAPFRSPAPLFNNMSKTLSASAKRKFTVDVGNIIGPVTTLRDIQLTLPVGWTADLPKNVTATSIAGKYEVTYAMEGRVLSIKQRMQGARGVYAPERIAEVNAWFKAVAADDVEFIQLKAPITP